MSEALCQACKRAPPGERCPSCQAELCVACALPYCDKCGYDYKKERSSRIPLGWGEPKDEDDDDQPDY